MKVKSLAANLGTNFGHRIGRGSPLEGRRGPPVVLFSTACWFSGVIPPLFGQAGSLAELGRRVVEEP